MEVFETLPIGRCASSISFLAILVVWLYSRRPIARFVFHATSWRSTFCGTFIAENPNCICIPGCVSVFVCVRSDITIHGSASNIEISVVFRPRRKTKDGIASNFVSVSGVFLWRHIFSCGKLRLRPHEWGRYQTGCRV